MKLVNPAANPVTGVANHTDYTAQEIAGDIVGAKCCIVKIGTAEPGASSDFHVHSHQEEVFYVLEGALTMIDKDRNKLTAGPGLALYVAAGDEHAAFNLGDVKAVYLAVKAPAA
jgi:uncharacterized cupin superfamily protein